VNALAFVARHGVVLASARGPVPSLAEAVAGEAIRGSWWAHEKGRAIFRALTQVGESSDVRSFRLVGGKLTFVHRRLWPALLRLADELGPERVTAITQRHTERGSHENVLTPCPDWAPAGARRAARGLSAEEARELLGPALSAPSRSTSSRRRAGRPRSTR
jgi:hypothetical protein